ncbi:MAG: amino acid-binding protein [Dehalococcoidia bacterium]|nr:amino acid-binding protein [Dehalococcoidia bacterium]
MAGEPFFIRQIVVFMDKGPGNLAKLTRHLSARGINLRALSVSEKGDFGTARIVVPDPDNCIEVLKEAGYHYRENDVLAVEVADQPGGMADVLDVIAGENLNVDYIYCMIDARRGLAGVILRTSDLLKTIAALQAKGVKLLTQQEITPL